ncbi:MAG: AAA family ATPase [Lentisphaeraceae bacterium]|nr:AAA family ATPase [Lentisphaeraceae bacterium]
MERLSLKYLQEWQNRKSRKPIIIRGARQVGKSFLVNLFCKESNLDLLELNLEYMIDYHSCFEINDVNEIISLLEIKSGKEIIPGKTLLFFDEIQAYPQLLPKLRYFYEKIPELHIIAAGSLLEFYMDNLSSSMPVGRIEYLHLGPMSFKEFLSGLGKTKLREAIENFELEKGIHQAIHQELIKLYKLYLCIGGMPEAVQTYKDTQSFLEVDRVKQGILSTYQDDFNKYGSRIETAYIQKVFSKLPAQVGQKLKYINIDRALSSTQIKNILHLFELAKVYYPVKHSSSNGIPIRAEVNEKFQKALFLDVGLYNKACGLAYSEILESKNLNLVNKGSVTEQFIGQHLLYRKEYFEDPELFYWCRQKAQSSAEVDYVITAGTKIIPVEVKTGKTGTLKSLHMFLHEKGQDLGLRFNSETPSLLEAKFSIPNTAGTYRLLSLPHYLVEETDRIINKII